jgi:hypothetical protein
LVAFGTPELLAAEQPGPKKWMSYSGPTQADLTEVKMYGSLFIDEWAKYPTDWVKKSKLKDVVFVKGLKVSNSARAATYDPAGPTMFYDVKSRDQGNAYARQVVHHEFDHLLTLSIVGSDHPADPTWVGYNPPGFKYGDGGGSCHQPNSKCVTGIHPRSGFVSGYAMSSMAEDQAELYACLMTDGCYQNLQRWLPADPALTKKVANYKRFIAVQSPEMSGAYFDQINP